MNALELLVWIEKGGATVEKAQKKGLDGQTVWDQTFFDGLYSEAQDGSLALTEKGEDFLSDARATAG